MLKLNNITKQYPGVIALDDVSIEFKDGEVHALMGENGAGKSTLIKTVAGAIKPSLGTIEVDNEVYTHMTPQIASKHGIAVIYQETMLCEPLTVAENIYLGKKFGKIYSKKRLFKMADELFKEYGFNLRPDIPVMALSSANKQLVEICKAISNDCKIIIMDEPTSSLASDDVELLFRIIKQLKEKGVTVIYISHRLDEVFEITEKVSILRDGKYIGTVNTKDTNREELIKMMVGRELKNTHPKRNHEIKETVLKIENLTGNSVENINFELHKGEILGLAGLVGSGRTETAELIVGAKRKTSGKIIVDNKEIKLKSPSDAIKYGIGLIPEDRKIDGCIQHNSVLFNTTLICNKEYMNKSIINEKKRIEIVEKYKEQLDIKVPSIRQEVINLSGGNQQKVVVAKTMAANLDIIIFDEPTKGIDVGAKKEIYELMNEMTKNGKSIIMISSDMEEVLGMSDRILVYYEGSISGELSKEEFSQEKILALASGLSKEEL